ncbi:MAG: hypothetical protein GX661_05550, partial [Acholeplasmataceae bacterium]|nr:hypothetical protein [Acholeplasmataceae bacterium]
NIAIKTGLKESYELNETLTLTGIVLTVTYNDFSSEEINLTTAMIIGTAPNTTSAGTKTLTIKIGDVQKSFTFTVVDTSQPQKQVKAMEIVSGLNETYDVNDPFDITDIQIKITFDDDSETTLYVTSSMVVGTAPNTQTTGTKTLTLKYQGYQESFTFTVVEAVLTPCEKLIESLEDFYQVLIYGDQNFFFSLSSMAMLSYENLDVMEFALDFIDDISDSWSNFTLVFQAKNVLVAYEEGMLELLFSSPSEDYGKTPYVNYDEASKTFQIGYWFEKSYVYYWFEQEILFDEATDSLKATTSVGVDDAAEIYGSVEYNQISPGAYAGNLYFPVEGNEDSNLYTNYEFQFTATTGVIAKNLWANRPTSIYKIESGLADYGTEGDYVLTMTEDELTLESTLSCPAADFFYAFSDINEENSIEAKFLERMIQLTKDSEDYYFGAYNYYLSGSDLAYYMYMLEYYEKKTFDFSEFYSINITVNGNTTTFTVDYDGEVETYSFSFTNNHLSFTYTTNYYVSMVEIVQEENTYYMQKVEGSDDYYNVYQAIYVHDDKMNMCFSHSETDTLPNSIFNGPDEGFASTGDEVFMVVKGTVTYIG